VAEKHDNDSWNKAYVGWLTHAVTTTFSIPPASNYSVAKNINAFLRCYTGFLAFSKSMGSRSKI